MARTTTLYRFFNAEGQLLYVGISKVTILRWGQHQEGKPWWPEVVSARLEHFETRHAALEAESTAIAAENPRYNVARPRPAKVVTQPRKPRWSGITPRQIKEAESWIPWSQAALASRASRFGKRGRQAPLRYWKIGGDSESGPHTVEF